MCVCTLRCVLCNVAFFVFLEVLTSLCHSFDVQCSCSSTLVSNRSAKDPSDLGHRQSVQSCF